MHENSFLIIDIRKGTNDLNDIKNYFEIKIIDEKNKHMRFCYKKKC